MIDVKGKWALITGASRGIGYHTALFMAKRGCNLILHSRDISHTKKVLKEVKAIGVDAYSVKADLAIHEEVVAMLDEIEEKTAKIDIVFNNAGIQVSYRTDYYSTPPSDFELHYIVNLIAVTTICYRLLPPMIKRGFGRVINTTSGIDKDPHQAGYSASKAALNKYTKDLATTLDGTDVILSLSDPGWCRTDLGGSQATNSVESSLPGSVLGAFVNDKKSGRVFSAQKYAEMTLEDALKTL